MERHSIIQEYGNVFYAEYGLEFLRSKWDPAPGVFGNDWAKELDIVVLGKQRKTTVVRWLQNHHTNSKVWRWEHYGVGLFLSIQHWHASYNWRKDQWKNVQRHSWFKKENQYAAIYQDDEDETRVVISVRQWPQPSPTQPRKLDLF